MPRTPKDAPIQEWTYHDDGSASIQLIGGNARLQGSPRVYVDAEDVPKLQAYQSNNRWVLARERYPATYYGTKSRSPIRLARVILDLVEDPLKQIVPRDGDFLNCRKDNLETVERWIQNRRGRYTDRDSGERLTLYPLVRWASGAWTVAIHLQGRKRYMGGFADPRQAIELAERLLRSHGRHVPDRPTEAEIKAWEDRIGDLRTKRPPLSPEAKAEILAYTGSLRDMAAKYKVSISCIYNLRHYRVRKERDR